MLKYLNVNLKVLNINHILNVAFTFTVVAVGPTAVYRSAGARFQILDFHPEYWMTGNSGKGESFEPSLNRESEI